MPTAASPDMSSEKPIEEEEVFRSILGPCHTGGRGLTRRFIGPHLVFESKENSSRHHRFSKADRHKIRTLWKKELRRGKEGRSVALNNLELEHPQITWQGSVFEVGKDIKTICELLFGNKDNRKLSANKSSANMSDQTHGHNSTSSVKPLIPFSEGSHNSDHTPQNIEPSQNNSRVIRKDRVLFKEGWTPRQDLPHHFTDDSMAKFDISWSSWQEIALVQKQDFLEFWFQHRISFRGEIRGRLKPKHVIQLTSRDCYCSLFSTTDLVLCLTYPRKVTDPREAKSSRTRRKLHVHSGTTIFLIQTRSQSAMYDLFWRIWASMKKEIPSTLELTVVPLEVKLLIPTHATETQTENATLGVSLREDDIFSLARDNIRKFPQWKSLADDSRQLMLAWRRNNYLSWIDQYPDYEGNTRPWTIICAAIFNQISSGNKSLELRPARHFDTNVRLEGSPELFEPPGIEGYTTLSRSKNNHKERLYFHSHDNYIFLSNPTRVEPPQPPWNESYVDSGEDSDNNEEKLKRHLMIIEEMMKSNGDSKAVDGSDDGFKWKDLYENIFVKSEKVDGEPEGPSTKVKPNNNREVAKYLAQKFLDNEKERLRKIMLSTRRVLDLKDIKRIQKVTESEDTPKSSSAKIHCVELESFIGKKIWLEVNSEEVASELESCLSNLREYWAKRTYVDINQFNTNGTRDNVTFEQDALSKILAEKKGKEGGASQTLKERRFSTADEDAQNEETTLLLGNVFNRCISERCRTILQHGRVYEKQSFRGSFKEVLMFLMDGQLFMYDNLAKIVHRRLGTTISLADAYLVSGKLCEDMLDKNNNSGTWDPKGLNTERLPRMYEDGLMSVDGEDDCTFMIWQKRGVKRNGGGLGSKHHLAVFRARSKMECDKWVYALNCEIEYVRRKNKERELEIKGRLLLCSYHSCRTLGLNHIESKKIFVGWNKNEFL